MLSIHTCLHEAQDIMWIWFEIQIMDKIPNISQGQLGEAQSFVRAPLSLGGGRQEKFGER